MESDFRAQRERSEVAQQRELVAAERSRKRQLAVAALVLLLLTIALTVYALRLRVARRRISEEVNHQNVLRSELQHRVKNNLQLLISLLEAKADDATDETVVHELTDMADRVHNLAAVHHLLDGLDPSTDTDAAEYIRALTSEFYQLHSELLEPVFVDATGVPLPVKKLIPIGLILGELLTNTVKHYLGERALVTVAFQIEGPVARLRYDDGQEDISRTQPPRATPHPQSGNGLYLIESMVRQLRGKITAPTAAGAFACEFPLNGRRS